jgi:hypothetical protein
MPPESCVLSDRGIWAGLITRSEESYRVWCLSVIVKPRYCGGPDSLRAGAPQKNKSQGEKINIILQFILLTMKTYLPDCRIAENTNPLHFRHGRDETGFVQDFF